MPVNPERPRPSAERWTPERRMARTRAALIESARHAFAARGFEGASLDEIAAGAGYTRGAIYKHFANKEDLFFAVVEDFNAHVLDSFAEQLEGEPGSALDTRKTAATWMRALGANENLWALLAEFSLYEFRNPEVRSRSVEWRRQNRETVIAFMELQSAATGITFKVDKDTLAGMLLTVSEGFLQAASRGDADAEELFATFLELFLPAIVEGRQE